MNNNSTLSTDELPVNDNSTELSAETTSVSPEPAAEISEAGDSPIGSFSETPSSDDHSEPAVAEATETVEESSPEEPTALSDEPASMPEVMAEAVVEETPMDAVEIPESVSEPEISASEEAQPEDVPAPPAATEMASEVEILVVEDHEMEEMEKEDAEAVIEDYSALDKEQLVKIAEQMNRDSDPVVANRAIQKIKPLFEALYAQDKAEALEKFVAEGGDPETFEFKHHALEQRFHQAQKGIYEKRKLSQEFQQKERGKNLEAKLTILEQLRQLVDDHEHTPGYDKFKVIREEWKKIGPVGPEHAQNLNASFYSLIERFYSLSEIYHNLRDFDRKKNLELKQELIAKIEKLASEPMISKAMKDLMSYQDDYRGLGPVPKDRQEEIKDRLKKAVDVIYERRRAFNDERKKLISEEVTLKEAILAKMVGLDSFVATGVKEWREKTTEVLAFQEEWKNIPGRSREKSAELNKQFWNLYKKFMHAKGDFFRQMEKAKQDVISAKQALIDEVDSLKEGEDWDGIANRMKHLQGEWKKIAPVFGKEGQKLYDAFRAGMDHFFTRLRDQRSGEDKIQSENLVAKEAVCAEIEALAASGAGSRKKLDELKDQFRNIGFVPMKSIQKINARFSKAMIEMIDSATEIQPYDKEKLKINILSNRSTYSTEGVKTLRNQEGYIQKRLLQLRKDVGNLEDNVSMFKMSKNAMAMIEDVQKRINLSKLEIKELESQLKEIRNAEKNG